MNRKTGETSDKAIIKYEMNFIDSCKFFLSYCQNFLKISWKKCNEFRYKCKNCKYAHIKNMRNKKWINNEKMCA